MTVQSFAGGAIAAVGVGLIVVAGVGLVRLPDAYNRINAVTKAATLGVVCVLVGTLVLAPSPASAGVLVVAALLQLLTAPFSSYALGRAAYRSGSPLAPITHHDELTPIRPAPPRGRGR